MSEDNVISGPPGIDLPDTSLGEFILDKLAKNSLRIIQVIFLQFFFNGVFFFK